MYALAQLIYLTIKPVTMDGSMKKIIDEVSSEVQAESSDKPTHPSLIHDAATSVSPYKRIDTTVCDLHFIVARHWGFYPI